MLNQIQILEKIRGGESSAVEFKEVKIQGGKIKQPHRDGLSDEIAAFANQKGGIIIFGVPDQTHAITGVDDVRLLATFITEICGDSIDPPPPLLDFYIDNVGVPDEAGEEKILVYVEIGQSLWLHKSKNGYFYRHGNSKREMSTEQVARKVQSRSQVGIISFDGQAVPNTQKASLNESLYQRFINSLGHQEDVENLLLKRRLLVEREGGYQASVAGILMCSVEPDNYLPNSFICAVQYSGKEKDANYQLDAKDFKGPLDKQIMDAFEFIRKNTKTPARKEVGREETPQYSMKAVFEAIVNAVIHRDYSKPTSKIRLFMFADRLEIYSPGALANTLTIENLPYNQVTRNELLARLLSEIDLSDSTGEQVGRRHFLERRGEGVGIILRESHKLSGKKPDYKMHGEELCLTIFAAEPPPK